jgi:hypothetical protein
MNRDNALPLPKRTISGSVKCVNSLKILKKSRSEINGWSGRSGRSERSERTGRIKTKEMSELNL